MKLTEKYLLDKGFTKQKSITFDWKDEYVIQPENYSWQIGVLIGHYSDDNPNSGCVSIGNFEDEQIPSIPEDLYDKQEWTKEDQERANSHTETYKAWRQPIAYYINTEEKLEKLYSHNAY